MVRQYRSALASIVKEMNRTNPDPNKARSNAAAGINSLDALIRQMSDGPASSRFFNASGVEHLIDALNRREAWDHVTSWDEAAQRVSCLGPSQPDTRPLGHGTQSGSTSSPFGRAPCACLKSLTFPKGFDSPRGFDPGRIPARHSEGSDVPVKDREARAFP